MTQTIDEVYFEWLTHRVEPKNARGKTYLDLMGQLHTKEFVWLVPNDDNRLEDAVELRHHFVNENRITDSGDLLIGVPPISVLEVILSLSQRCAFAGGGYPPEWAWQLLENLELHKMSDPLSRMERSEVDDILETLIYRNYEPDGVGGLFPLTHPKENQTKVEIWYQMNAYIEELEQ